MLSPDKARVERLRSLFEGREAIYVEKGALRVRVGNIRSDFTRRSIFAEVEEIPTAGLPTGALWSMRRHMSSPLRWDIGAGYRHMSFSDHTWKSDYCWSLYFAPSLIESIVSLALQSPESLDPHQRYDQIMDLLNNRIMNGIPKLPQWVFADYDSKLPQRVLANYDSPLRHNHAWHLKEIAEYVGESRPDVFIEPFCGGETTVALLLENRVKSGIIVESNPYVAAFWREAIHTDEMRRKVSEFKATDQNVQMVVDNPDRDRAFWTLVKSQCSWPGRSGRLEAKGFLEWDVAHRWKSNINRLLVSLTQLRSLAHRLKIIEWDGLEVLKEYDTATAYVRPRSFRPRDKWLQEQERLFQTLGARNGRWALDYYALTPFWMEPPFKELSEIGEVWRVPAKLMDPPLCYGFLLSDRRFALERNKLLPQAEPIFYRGGTSTPCPHCGTPLTTPRSKQCRSCGRDWH